MAAVHGERGLPRPAWPLGCAQPTICYFLCVRKCRRADSRPIAHRCTRIYAPVALENHLADKEPRRTCTSPVSESSEIPFIPTMKAIFIGAPRPYRSFLPFRLAHCQPLGPSPRFSAESEVGARALWTGLRVLACAGPFLYL